MSIHRFALCASALLAAAAFARADQHTGGVPVLSSRPGAAYTIYLDPAGFNYSGTWDTTYTPGSNPALNGVASNGTFNANAQTEIRAIWAATAQAYYSFNVNVTTVDPAIAANQAGTDAARQAYYDSQARMMHTVVGPHGATVWSPAGADGIATIGTIATAQAGGRHTNWMFTEALDPATPIPSGQYIGAVAAHETGHTFNLNHQSDYNANTLVNEYGVGDSANGNGNYDGFMGNAYGRQRNAWRSGDAHTGLAGHTQNDVGRMMSSNAGLDYADSGFGHTMATASALPLTGNTVNSAATRGVINPASTASPAPIGANNYTQDWFSFNSDGVTAVSLTCFDGTNFLSPTAADNGITLRSTLSIFNSSGALVGTATEDASTLFETYSSTLALGAYFARVSSFGGHAQVNADFNAANYYDMGGYFLAGAGFAIPAPGAVAILCMSGGLLLRRRRTA